MDGWFLGDYSFLFQVSPLTEMGNSMSWECNFTWPSQELLSMLWEQESKNINGWAIMEREGTPPCPLLEYNPHFSRALPSSLVGCKKELLLGFP